MLKVRVQLQTNHAQLQLPRPIYYYHAQYCILAVQVMSSLDSPVTVFDAVKAYLLEVGSNT
jgi:hypothetical protein